MEFIYVLRLVPRLLDEENWTDKEHRIVERHFLRLQQLVKEGKVVLAGRTLVTDDRKMGIVILQVDSEEEARRIMENDDAVKEEIMTAELFPFRIALNRSDL
jgi:uncharacterized protein YciI